MNPESQYRTDRPNFGPDRVMRLSYPLLKPATEGTVVLSPPGTALPSSTRTCGQQLAASFVRWSRCS